jgi:hypothetical protein
MEKLYLEFAQAAAERDRALRIATALLARASRNLEETSAAIRENEAKIAKSKLILKGLHREGAD